MGTKIRPINLHTSVDTHIQGLIDSSFVQARSSGGTDSASTQAMIDSNFANMATAIHIPDGNGASDNKITFGADSDLKIFHTGSNSVIQDAGTGSLFLQGSSAVQITDLSSNKMAVFNDGGSTELYHNNVKKFETTSSGATLTGDLELISTDDGAGDDPSLILKRNSSSPANFDNQGDIKFLGENSASEEIKYGQIQVQASNVADGSEESRMVFSIFNDGADKEMMFLDANQGGGVAYLTAGIDLMFEGATSNGNETTLTVVDPTADRTITFPDATGTVALTSDISVTASSTTTFTNKTLTNPTINGATLSGTFGGTANLTGLVLAGASPLKFEGSNDDANETSLAVQNPTADRTITLPDMTGSIKELLISEGSMNASELVFNSGTITTEYSELRLVLSNVFPSSNGQTVNLRVGSANAQDTGSNYGQAIYYSGYYGSTNAYSINTVSATQSLFYLATGYAALGTGTGQNGHFEITFLNPNTSSRYKLFKINSQIYSYYPMLMGRYIDAAVWKSTAAINYIRVYPSTGNLALEYKLYGVKS